MTNEELNAKIRALCDASGMLFAPWECHPADADEGHSPWPVNTEGGKSWPKAQQLRRKLIAEIEATSAN